MAVPFTVSTFALAAAGLLVLMGTLDLLPPVTELRKVSIAVAIAVARQAHKEGLTEGISADEIEAAIHAKMWTPQYLPYRRIP